jgi:8-oxo-dGTP pyrophosphatase MutT (NUDIX family)
LLFAVAHDKRLTIETISRPLGDRTFIMFKQSGVVPYRFQQGRLELLLITSSKRKRWGIPKGWIEPWMSAAESAAKEAREEAGVLGKVQLPAIGFYEHRKLGVPCRVEVFLMRVDTVLETWDEADRRQREWVSLAKAMKRVKQTELQQLLQHIHRLDERYTLMA